MIAFLCLYKGSKPQETRRIICLLLCHANNSWSFTQKERHNDTKSCKFTPISLIMQPLLSTTYKHQHGSLKSFFILILSKVMKKHVSLVPNNLLVDHGKRNILVLEENAQKPNRKIYDSFIMFLTKYNH